MPKQGLQMDEGTIIKWFLKEGERCMEGEPLFEMETDKLTITIDAPATGTILKIIHPEGDVVPITEVIAIISEEGENTSYLNGKTDTTVVMPVPVIAKGKGVDIDEIKGPSMADGKNVPAYPRAEQDSGEDEIEEMTLTRRTIGRRLFESQHSIAWATIRMDVDMSEAKALKNRYKAKGKDMTFNVLIIMAIARALKKNPRMNSQMTSNHAIALKKHINVGFAVATDRGLMVPVIKDADRKTAVEIDSEARTLAEAAKNGTLTMGQATEGTFTLSNLGMMKVQSAEAIPNPPETGILATGQVRDEAIVKNGTIGIAPMMVMTLTYDHRILDGDESAKFVDDVRNALLECNNW
ncbi:MAG: dihydrolipoamide acetyltransferase family protein [Eubacteriales bacterium]|nr:dihydrolipoamide acetyltransferase family protein [Eubacteriales bacterium]